MVKKLLRLLQTNIFLLVIIAIFLVTRIYKIAEIPASVYWDEASIGYNAYSILTTGKDEWGEFLPLHFRAFGEFKLPVYIYSVVASEGIFGLNAFAVRLPSVLFGVLTIVGLYLFTDKLFKNKHLSLLTSFIFSVSPWFFLFSRTGYEAVAGLAFFIFGLYFLLFTKEKNIFIIPSVLSFILSIYSYNSFRILTAIILFLYFVYKIYLFVKAKNLKVLKIDILAGLLFLVSLYPIYKLITLDAGLSRFVQVGDVNNLFNNLLKNLNLNYIFITGDSNLRSHIPNVGQLFAIDFVFILTSIIFAIYKRNIKIHFILGLTLIGFIPAIITKENPHALRSIFVSSMFPIIISDGILKFKVLFKNKIKQYLSFIVVVYLYLFSSYYIDFLKNYNNVSYSAWQGEYKEIFKVKKEGCVDDEYAQPYIFALFYCKVDPNYFISTRELNPVSDWGFSTVKSFGNYKFLKTCNN